jgi:hypothetical protein
MMLQIRLRIREGKKYAAPDPGWQNYAAPAHLPLTNTRYCTVWLLIRIRSDPDFDDPDPDVFKIRIRIRTKVVPVWTAVLVYVVQSSKIFTF